MTGVQDKELYKVLENMIDPFISDGSGAIDEEGFFNKLIPYIQANYLPISKVKKLIPKKQFGWGQIPCPDNKIGCLVLHQGKHPLNEHQKGYNQAIDEILTKLGLEGEE